MLLSKTKIHDFSFNQQYENEVDGNFCYLIIDTLSHPETQKLYYIMYPGIKWTKKIKN